MKLRTGSNSITIAILFYAIWAVDLKACEKIY